MADDIEVTTNTEPTGDASPELSAQTPETTDTQIEEQETSGDDAAAVETKPPKGVAKRIDELTRLRREAERDRNYWRELAMRTAAGPPPPQQPQSPAAVQPQLPPKPNQEDFSDYDDYVEAMADWKAEIKYTQKAQEAQARYRMAEQQEAERKQVEHFRQRAARYLQQAEEFSDKVADFDEVTKDPTLPINEFVREYVIDSPIGPQMVYWLGKNREKAAQIHQMSAGAAARELRDIESRLVEAGKKTRKSSSAPDPINPIGGGGGVGTKDPSKMSVPEYVNWRNQQEGIAK
jgi:hypothetical protein